MLALKNSPSRKGSYKRDVIVHACLPYFYIEAFNLHTQILQVLSQKSLRLIRMIVHIRYSRLQPIPSDRQY